MAVLSSVVQVGVMAREWQPAACQESGGLPGGPSTQSDDVAVCMMTYRALLQDPSNQFNEAIKHTAKKTYGRLVLALFFACTIRHGLKFDEFAECWKGAVVCECSVSQAHRQR